jgi:hypothetical protein
MLLNNRLSRWFLALVALAAAFTLGVFSVNALTSTQPSTVSFGTGFTYQGYLRDDNGNPLTDTCDFTFRLYDALTLGNQIGGDDVVNGVAVTNGLFTTVVNNANEFGAAGFNGGGRFLDISVQCGGDATATGLSPRQPINPVPYARFAERFAGYENLIVVAKQGGDFTSVGEAIDAIGVDPAYAASSASNRYLVYVAPGVYEGENIQMKEYVDIEGSGQGVTVLTASGGSNGIKPESATLVGASNAELRNVTVENVSSGPSNWAFAIYTAGNTSIKNVTAVASGGGWPRGIVAHNGGVAILKDVSLLASGGGVSNVGLDVYLASALGDTIFANVSGGQEANGLYINNATSEVRLENVTSFASGGATQTNGMYIDQSQVNLASFDATVSSAASLATGIYCTSADSRLSAREITVFGVQENSGGNIRGILANNCSLILRDATIDVSSSGQVYGLYLNASDGEARNLEINQLDIQANSSANIVNGLLINTSSGTLTNGRVNDVTIQASGHLSTSNSYGLAHRADGTIQYQDLAIDITGEANFMYGIQASKGSPAFQNVLIAAYGEAQTTVFGTELINPAIDGSMDNAQILARNTLAKDAVGLKSNGADYSRFHNISTSVFAPAGVWGYDFIGAIVSATDLETLVEGNGDGTTVRGIRCQGGSADIHNARVTAQTSSPDLASQKVYGMYAYDCELTLSSSQIRVRDVSGLRIGLYAYANSGAPPSFVRDSYLRGVSGAIQAVGYADLVVVGTQLEGGVTVTDTNAQTTCTAISHGTATSFSFTPGPVSPCP